MTGISPRKTLFPWIAAVLTSSALYRGRRLKAEVRRRPGGGKHEIYFFHDPEDPYSRLLDRALPLLERSYDIEVARRPVPPPDPASAPHSAMLAEYARLDAERIAPLFPLDPETGPRDPMPAQDADLAEGAAVLEALGHYQGGMIYYGGEWYWGLDRLFYLEERLRGVGAAKDPAEPPVFRRPDGRTVRPAPPIDNEPYLEVFFSFRSPYSYLALEKLPGLLDRTGVDLRLRPVMPMVERGIPLSRNKRRYILFDSAREARRQKIPFGRIADPLAGNGYRNALALFPLAEADGKGLEFSRRAMRAAFAEGRYLSDKPALRRLARETGLDWGDCRKALDGTDWKGRVEENAAALGAIGLWGVPAVRWGEFVAWGQDRMWLLERSIAQQRIELRGP